MFDIVSAMKEFFSRKMAPAKPLRHNFVKFRPTRAALRNPADPIQAARIEAAAVKRARKADKLHDWACRNRHFNAAHCGYIGPFRNSLPCFNLDILYVNHS